MSKLLRIYNNAVHSSFGYSPSEMFSNPELEKEYIFEQLEHSESQKRVSNFKLDVGSFVLYIMPRISCDSGGLSARADGLKKRRYNTSKDNYRIENVNCNMYTLIAKDETAMNLHDSN